MTARPTCPRCRLPERTCVCGLVTPVANAVDVLVLQHPGEAREAKGSVRLLALSLARCRVVVGEMFDEPVLREMLQGGGRVSVLLYPEEAGLEQERAADDFAAAATQLVVIDGTWRKSLRMLKSNPLLEALPRLGLRPDGQARYALLRKARKAGQLSTLEAVCAALGKLEASTARYAPLLESFDRFVVAGASGQHRGASAPG